jgi:Ca-activated chloride channel family protein
MTTGGRLELSPGTLPDLYAGQSLVLLGKTNSLPSKLTVSGRIGTRSWSSSVNLSNAVESPAVARMWARQRIDDVETERTIGKLDYDKADAEIEKLGLDYSIVTSRTSLVAEDEKRVRPSDHPLTREELPINLPAGWDFDVLFGGAAAKAAMANAADRANGSVTDASQQIDLPQTATNYWPPLRNGLLVALLGMIGLLWQRRSKVAA